MANPQLTQLKAFLLCESHIIDAFNRFSLINIYNHLVVNEFPASLTAKFFISFLCSEGFHKVNISLQFQDQPAVTLFEQEFVQGISDKVDVISEINFTATAPGLFVFILSFDNVLMGTTELMIHPEAK